MSRLELVPIQRAGVMAFLEKHHRHSGRPAGYRVAIAAALDGEVVGVATLGRCVARHLNDGWTIEATRVCTDGTRNATSFLYAACRRLAFAMGYLRVVTYTLPEEGGASLRGAGWKCLGERGGGSWDRPSRPRVDDHPTQVKIGWETVAPDGYTMEIRRDGEVQSRTVHRSRPRPIEAR